MVMEQVKKAGRPLKFRSVKQLQEKIDAYFAETPENRWTITGLALALDTSRNVLCDYQGKEQFSNAITRAKLKIENGYEIDLKQFGRPGTQFALKNFGWLDKQEQEVNVSGRMEIKHITRTIVDPKE